MTVMVINGKTGPMISTGTEVKSLPSGMQTVLDSGRLNCLRHLLPTTEIRTGIRSRIHMTPDPSQIWVRLGDGGGQPGVVGVFELLMGSKWRLLKMMKEVIPRARCEDGRNW